MYCTVSRDSSLDTVTGLLAKRTGNRSSIPDEGKSRSLYSSVQPGTKFLGRIGRSWPGVKVAGSWRWRVSSIYL